MAEVAIIGSGAVGVACAGSVLRQGLASRLVFYDRNGERALGEALDFQHAAPLLPDCEVEGRPLHRGDPGRRSGDRGGAASRRPVPTV